MEKKDCEGYWEVATELRGNLKKERKKKKREETLKRFQRSRSTWDPAQLERYLSQNRKAQCNTPH